MNERTAMKRRDFLKAMGVGTASLAAGGYKRFSQPLFAADSTTAASKKPNVLFIVVDDLRPQLNCFGHKQMISPNIDRLASEGVIFSRCYCQVPVCGASRASLLTGTRPTRTRFIDYKTWVDDDLPEAISLPKHFKNNGYHTISNGKVFHHLKDDADSWSEEPSRPKGDWVGRGYLLEKNKAIVAKAKKGLGPAFEDADVADSDYQDGRTADKSISDLKRLKDMDKPFFLAAGFLKPHLPFNAPKKYWDMYKRENINLADNPFRPKGAPDAALHNWGELRRYADIPKKGPLTDDFARTLIHGYYACVSYTDAQIGRLLAELGRLGLRENTIVVLWGDHGWQLGEHSLWCKHCNFETSLHSPLIVSAPGIKGGQKTDALTEFVDVYPSLCELSNLPVPANLEGTSFVPLMKAPSRDWKKAVFSRWKNGDSVKTDRYRYTEWTKDDSTVYARMLYDHHVDPMENVNISELPQNKKLVEKMSKMLKQGFKAAVPKNH